MELGQLKGSISLHHSTETEPFTATDTPKNVLSPSPETLLPPSRPDEYFISNHYSNTHISGQTPNACSDPSASNISIPPTPGSLAGRKRSRGDISADDEESEQLEDGSVATPIEEEPKKPRGKPIYGPGMTLIYPEDPGYEAAAESQSGTWVDERAECKPFHLSHLKRPSISSRKTLRKDTSASGSDDLAQLVLPPQMREATMEPLIDEATRVLGISWTRMDSSEALRISQAAYAKWIQNHYPGLKDVTVWFENSAIPGYLVAAHNGYNGQQGYYIFSNDLTEARVVTTDPSQLVPRLQMLPALHLAAPGGHIRAESGPIIAAQSGRNGVRGEGDMSEFSRDVSLLREEIQDHCRELNKSSETQEPNGVCSAHEMDLD